VSPRPGRRGAFGALWTAVRRGRRPGAPRTATLVRAVPRMVAATLAGQYTGLSRSRLGLMGLAALYIASPIDLVPEGLLLVVGLADDAAVLAWLSGALLSETEAFLTWERTGSTGGPRGGAEHGPGGGPDVVPGEVIR